MGEWIGIIVMALIAVSFVMLLITNKKNVKKLKLELKDKQDELFNVIDERDNALAQLNKLIKGDNV